MTGHPFDDIVTNTARIQRDGRDCPYVFTPDHDGSLDFTRGKTIKTRKGYSRVTTYVDALDDKTNLDGYHQRNVIAGIVADPSLLLDAKVAVDKGTLDDRDVKDRLNNIAARAREAMYENRKADTGTAIHHWCEHVDLRIADGATPADALAELVGDVYTIDGHTFAFDDFADDVAAYVRVTVPFMRPVAVETLTINDDLKVAGTPDRLAEWVGATATLPDGDTIETGDIIVTDLKTGSVEYGVGKFAMQLGVYANSVYYDQGANTRRPLPDRLRRDWAVIIHVPAGQGTAQLLWLDVAAGWDAVVNLAGPVRRWRTASRKLATPIALTVRDQIAGALTPDEVRALYDAATWTAEDVEYAAARVVELGGESRAAA